uniref:Complex I-ESSS n=1 Tax=Tetraselmis chuii TaxID=63592 RepID=A0A7S1X1N6_9CHLO|mmetsp:Transcript_22942/g.40827  ORF Transcript_22942/g.40827 Transcript_22942/m.40827 type:complete len:106 (+) Transcript_22942:139-456(+)|eukprot:CAMPEP_0177754268 /NCGR_PEP_ID=MMETSP0491_2-20121128/1917_1 /TAXON_ID=63592 /ORGANISM="Tetraselmis chuii, Strain PLY429" /LENGTH=105 /DNA_ID=CAMNT_0019269637 /DNA_START=136 /DNA_END=453 /DNA_ORIENTATION=+
MASRTAGGLRALLARGRSAAAPNTRGGSPPGGFFGEGTKDATHGVLFGETPPPPGQKRKWESWEAPWYATGILTVIILGVGLPARPDSRLETWAHEEALRREAAK